MKLYYTKSLNDQASSLAPDWILLLRRPRILMSIMVQQQPFNRGMTESGPFPKGIWRVRLGEDGIEEQMTRSDLQFRSFLLETSPWPWTLCYLWLTALVSRQLIKHKNLTKKKPKVRDCRQESSFIVSECHYRSQLEFCKAQGSLKSTCEGNALTSSNSRGRPSFQAFPGKKGRPAHRSESLLQPPPGWTCVRLNPIS